MKIVCSDAKPVSPEIVENLKSHISKFKLPQTFVNFMAFNNTGCPLKDCIIINGEEHYIAYFMSFDKDDVYYYYNLLDSFLNNSDGKMIPFAVNCSSDYYCLNLENNGVYFWPHESEEDEFIPLNITFDELVDLF